MLVTSTLLFLGLAVRSGVDVAFVTLKRRTMTSTQRMLVRRRLQFLLAYALVLAVIYGVFIASQRH